MKSFLPKDSITELCATAKQIRFNIVELSHKRSAAHLASCLSCVDIFVALYWRALDIDPKDPTNPTRDRFILSKGHAASALYTTLCHRSFFPKEKLENFSIPGSNILEHPSPKCLPGVEWGTGSLGHGLSVSVGMALGSKLRGYNNHIFTLLSDGECNEGSVWEAAMFAPAKRLGNICAIVDYNKWQATGRSNEVLQLHSLKDKWESFGWNAIEVDGHDIDELCRTLSQAKKSLDKPTSIIAHTIKGKGVSFMEDDNNWHYRIPTKDEVEDARKELLVDML